MYKIIESTVLTTVATNLIEGAYLTEILDGSFKTKQVLVCPTNAIILNQNLIRSGKCISCGICKKHFPYEIEYLHESADYTNFKEYLFAHKMFIYRWIALMTNELSGTEVKTKGYSRDIRIPLVILKDSLNVFKCAVSNSEIDQIINDLDDIEYLLHESLDIDHIIKNVVLIEDNMSSKLLRITENQGNLELISLSSLYTNFIGDYPE